MSLETFMQLMISGVFKQLPRKQHRGIIVPEENNNKDNRISVNALIIPLRRQFTKYVHEDARKICQGNKRYYTVEQGKNTEPQSNPKERSKL